ncbi:MAG: shikimate dehydrogenase [Paracoccaceae bacterium]
MTPDEDDRPLVAGVVGWPVRHSRSPLLFEHWFARHGVPGRYVPLAVAPNDFRAVFEALPKAGLRGVNVTLPHKEAALALADEASEAACAIGAANTVVFDPVRGRVADNTDGYGFAQNLRAGAPGWDPKAGPALVLGAGGAARAILHALLAEGVPALRLANRSRERAETLADHFGRDRVETVDWSERATAVDGAALVVNTTSLGMTGKPALDLALAALDPGAVVTDIVYAPLRTDLLREAERRGARTVDGLGRLLHLARPGFRAWFGPDPTVDDALRAACLEAAA